MLTIYRRHRAKCLHPEDRISKKCRCALWATGTHEGRPYRKALKTRSFERAQQIVREIENGQPEEEKKPGITLAAALDAFIKDCEGRNLNASTVRNYRTLRAEIIAFADDNHLCGLPELTGEHVREILRDRSLAARTAGKELERLRAMFKFCVANDWIAKNPAALIKAPQVKTLPRLPFTEQEVSNILAKANDDRELAFVLILRHTGLRIGDASLLKTSHLSENRLYLYTAKSGSPVHIVLPDFLVSLLKSLPAPGGYFFVRGESTVMHTTADLWRRSISGCAKTRTSCPIIHIDPAYTRRRSPHERRERGGCERDSRQFARDRREALFAVQQVQAGPVG